MTGGGGGGRPQARTRSVCGESLDDSWIEFDRSAASECPAWGERDVARQRSVSYGSVASDASLHRDLARALADSKSAPNSPSKSPTSPSVSGAHWAGGEALPGPAAASRYRKDFEELEGIGKGGFGSVFRVRQRLDDREYAVKKVKLMRPAEVRPPSPPPTPDPPPPNPPPPPLPTSRPPPRPLRKAIFAVLLVRSDPPPVPPSLPPSPLRQGTAMGPAGDGTGEASGAGAAGPGQSARDAGV